MLKGKAKRSLAFVLAACMLLALLPSFGAGASAASVSYTEVDPSVIDTGAAVLPEAEQDAEQDVPAADEEVHVIILFEQKSLAKKGFSTKDLLENEKAASYSSSLKKQQLSLVDRIEREALGGEKLEIRYQFTVAVNGVATVVPYGRIEQILAVDGVADVYLEERYELDETVQPDTATAGEMVGSYSAWADGYTGAGSDTGDITGVEPALKVYDFADGSTTFNQPVRPADSFIWQSGDSFGKSEVFPYPFDAYVSCVWKDAFPITENGAQEIEYYDVFGRLYTETVDVGTAFYHAGEDYSIHIEFSETELTGEAITLTTAAAEGTLLIFEKTGADTYVPLAPIDGDARVATAVRRTVIKENTELYICRYNIGREPDPDTVSGLPGTYRVHVYITNIAKGAPQATVYYYLEAAGREFTAEELAAYIAEHGEGGTFESRGAVTARYATSRTVTPTAGGSEYTFAAGETSHTFTYADDFGNVGSVTATLPAGLVVTGRPKPVVDTEAPEVAVDIYAKRAGILTRAESFRAGETAADIAAKFADVGGVQGYSLRLNISDKSMPCTVAVTAAEGVTLSGNVLTVDRAADFTVTVTDAVVRADRRQTLGLRWLIAFARKRGEKNMSEKLAGEIMDAKASAGGAFKKKEETHRMAEANKAFAHYRY